jgi:hypothetical protein
MMNSRDVLNTYCASYNQLKKLDKDRGKSIRSVMQTEKKAKQMLLNRMLHYNVSCAEVPGLQNEKGKPLYLRLRTTNSRRALNETRIREAIYDADKKFGDRIRFEDILKNFCGLLRDRCTVQTQTIHLSATGERNKKKESVEEKVIPRAFFDGLNVDVNKFNQALSERARISKEYSERQQRVKERYAISEQQLMNELRNKPNPVQRVKLSTGDGEDPKTMLITYQKARRVKYTKQPGIKDMEGMVERAVRRLAEQRHGDMKGEITWREIRKTLLDYMVDEYRIFLKQHRQIVDEEKLLYTQEPKKKKNKH